MKEIKVDENNERFYAENGILYERISDKPDDIMIIHIPAKLASKEYKIPSCAYIGSGLMCGNEKIVILTIPDGVINIFGQSFIFCTNLKVVYIPSSVTYIENDIFEYDYASELHKTIYGQEYSQAEESAEIFGYAFAAVRIENNEMHITKINLNGQTSVDIPESIDGYKIVIDEHAFDGIKNIIIYGEANGYVQSFAEANGFKYRIGF